MLVGSVFHMSTKTPMMSSRPQKKWYVDLKPVSGLPPRPKNHGCHGQTLEMQGVPLASHWSDTGFVVSGVLDTSMRSTLSDRMRREATSAARFGSDWLSRTSTSTGTLCPRMVSPLPTTWRMPPTTKLSVSPKPASGPVCGLT